MYSMWNLETGCFLIYILLFIGDCYMDTGTHCLIGAFTYSLLPERYKVKNLLLASIILAILPDADVFFSYTQELYLLLHRGITHSIFILPFISFIFAYCILRFIIPKHSPWNMKTMYAYVFILFLGHIYADIFTNYGTMALLPFSPYRVRIPGVFIIDLVMIVLLIIGIILGTKKRYTAGYIVATLLICYAPFSFALGSLVEYSVQKRYAPMLSQDSTVITYPAPFAPLYWNVIIEDEDSYYQTMINIVTKEITPLTQYKKIPSSFLELLEKEDSFFKTYFYFSNNMLVVADVNENNVVIAPLYYMPIKGAKIGRDTILFGITLHYKEGFVNAIELFPTLFPWRFKNEPMSVKEQFPLPNDIL